MESSVTRQCTTTIQERPTEILFQKLYSIVPTACLFTSLSWSPEEQGHCSNADLPPCQSKSCHAGEPPTNYQYNESPADYQLNESSVDHLSDHPPADHQSNEPPVNLQYNDAPANHQSNEPPVDHQSTEPPAHHQSNELLVDQYNDPPADHQCKLTFLSASGKLKQSHKYYTQVQGQLSVANKLYCDFLFGHRKAT